MLDILKQKRWSPYLSGGLAGLVFVISVLAFNGYFGSTTTFSRIGSLLVEPFADLSSIAFFTHADGLFTYHTLFDFQTFLVIGIVIGAFISSRLSKTFKVKHVPERFKEVFGNSKPKRHIIAFIGGVIMVTGARIADGCASWWGISSTSKLDLAGFSTMAFFFIGAVTVNFILRKLLARR